MGICLKACANSCLGSSQRPHLQLERDIGVALVEQGDEAWQQVRPRRLARAQAHHPRVGAAARPQAYVSRGFNMVCWHAYRNENSGCQD